MAKFRHNDLNAFFDTYGRKHCYSVDKNDNIARANLLSM